MRRKLTEKEKVHRAAVKLTKKLRAEAGPLFADQVEPIDEQRLLVQRRMGHAWQVECAERLRGDFLLDGLYVHQLERIARQHIPKDVVDRMVEHSKDRGNDLKQTYWLGVLRGERKVLGIREVDGPTTHGFRLVIDDPVWPPEGWVPPFTREQTNTLFWRRCSACGMEHAPGQAQCVPPARNDDDEIMAALKEVIRDRTATEDPRG